MSVSPTLEVEHLHLWRGERHVLQGVSFCARPGELVHVTGPNGAGKTTLLRVLAGLAQAEEGSARWPQADRANPASNSHSSLAFLGHKDGLDDALTVRENLAYGLGLAGRAPADGQVEEILDGLNIQAIGGLPAKVLSAGQRRRTSLARIFLSGATTWLLDEPYTHLDAQGRHMLNGQIEDHLADLGVVILTTHEESLLPRAADLHVSL